MHDPFVFIRKTLENAVDMHDEETIRTMSRMIDEAMLAMNAAKESPRRQTG